MKRSKKERGFTGAAAGRLLAAAALAAVLCLAAPAGSEIGAWKIPEWLEGATPPGAVTMKDLEIEISIDHGFAQTRLRQVFQNNTDGVIGGTYYLKLAPDSVLMDFGVWDDGRWTEAVVIEKERGRESFQEIVERMVDPALMEAPEAELTDAFRVEVAPIPARGTRRVETAFHQWLPIRAGQRSFLLPLKPGPSHQADAADHLRLSIKVADACPLSDVSVQAPSSVKIETSGGEPTEGAAACVYEARFDGGPVDLDRDLEIKIPPGAGQSSLTVLSYRDVETTRQDLSATGGQTYQEDSGYFLLEAYYNLDADTGAEKPRDVVVLLDTSLSMQFEKLDRAIEVLEALLAGLGEDDAFTIATMGAGIDFWRKLPGPATAAAVNRAMEFIRKTPLSGGTPLADGLIESIDVFKTRVPGRTSQLVAITDGRPTLSEIKHKRILEAVIAKNNERGDERCSINVFGIGEDTDADLLRDLANGSGGYFTWARESENISQKLLSFQAALKDTPLRNVRPVFDPAAAVSLIYPSASLTAFNRESLSWIGRCQKPADKAAFKVTGVRAGETLGLETEVPLPERASDHDFIPRLWAERRVDALLADIRDRGEDEQAIEEIIALSKRYKFPTPYTSYLVAPRAFLRPRMIRPHDPILTVKAAPGTRSVTALFPFGETRAMRRTPGEDIWETRFLVPGWMKDGRYFCRLVITGKDGSKTMEKKDFIVDSTPPRLKIRIANQDVRPGGAVMVSVDADPDTRKITAKLGALPAINVRWDDLAKINRGKIIIPQSWPPGEYVLRIIAEDFAHNITTMRQNIRVGG